MGGQMSFTFLTGRAERLGFDNQSAMAEAMGFKSTSVSVRLSASRQYFLIAKDVGD